MIELGIIVVDLVYIWIFDSSGRVLKFVFEIVN